MFETYEIAHIRYTSKDGSDVSDRVIIPTFIPTPSIKAIDVTEMSDEERVETQELLRDYAAYFETAVKRVFSFEDWISHTTGLSEGATPEVKWRTFLTDNIERLD